MSDTSIPDDPAERRAGQLLTLVATDSPQPGGEFTDELMRKVRVQRAVAAPLRAFGGLLAAVAGGIGAAALVRARRSGS